MASPKPPESPLKAETELPYEEDVMKLARYGEIRLIQKLFDTGKVDASYKDEQGLTPLHVRTDIPILCLTATDQNSVGRDQEPLRALPLSHSIRR